MQHQLIYDAKNKTEKSILSVHCTIVHTKVKRITYDYLYTKEESLKEANMTSVDFILEFSARNCLHLVDCILQDLSGLSLIRAAEVSQAWKEIVTQSKHYPQKLSQLFHHYQALHPSGQGNLTSSLNHLEQFNVEHHRMFPGGDVKTILVDKDWLYIGLASGLTKAWDISNFDNFKYPATKYFDPDNGKAVTHLDKNDKVLATGHGDIVLIWSLDSSSILSGSICLGSRMDFIGQLALSNKTMVTILTRFNAYLRIYKDYYIGKYEEIKLDVTPKKVSLTKEALVYSYFYQDELPWFYHHKLSIVKLDQQESSLSGGSDISAKHHVIDLNREVAWIFQDYPLLFVELAYLGNKELQMWDMSNLNHIYTVQIQDFSLRYLSMKNWIFWCLSGVGKGQLTYGSILDLFDQEFYKKKVIEDSDQQPEEEDNLHLSFISQHTLIFSKPGGIEMKVFGLKSQEQDEIDELC